MVDLVRLQVADRAANVPGVLQIDLGEPDLVPDRRDQLVLIGIPEHRADHLVVVPDELFREVGPVLPPDSCHERAARHQAGR